MSQHESSRTVGVAVPVTVPVAVTLAVTLAVGLGLVGFASAAEGASADARSVFGGGAVGAVGAAHLVRSTAGQSVVGPFAAGAHEIQAGFWITSGVTSSADAEAIPLAWRLYRAAPNPFSDHTSLQFDAPTADASVRLRLFDVSGRVVRTLVDGPVALGRHRAEWDGRDHSGKPLGPGVYLCVFESPGKRFSQKLLRVR